jgi:hypothetical protein
MLHKDCTNLRIATAVLDEIVGFRDPDPSNGERLRELAESEREIRMPLEELARTIIVREIDRRQNAAGRFASA